MRNLFTLLLMLPIAMLSAQDIHFSHIHATPMQLNPAMTGMFDQGQIRLIANSRLQWENFTNGYKTLAGSMDMKLKEVGNNNLLAGGLQLYSDRAGDLNFTTNTAALSVSVLKSLDSEGRNNLSFGLQGGYTSSRFDLSKMVGQEEEMGLISNGLNTYSYWDLSAGLGWSYTTDRHNFYYFGLSASHLNNPVVSFFDQAEESVGGQGESQSMLFRKLVLHGGAQFELSKQMTLMPSFIFVDQGPHRQIKMGSFVKYFNRKNFNKTNQAVYFGAWLRYYVEQDIAGVDAVNIALRFDRNRTIFTLSFDVNISGLAVVSGGAGGPEFSVVHILGEKNGKKGSRRSHKVKCPNF